MKAEELRIGNLVYNSHGDIHAIGCNCFHRFRYPSMDGNPSGFKPIPLTEEILLKCGFERFTHAFVINISDKGDTLTYNFTQQIWWIGNKPMYNMDIKTLHQLQNLYYALTGEELEVSL